MLAMLSAVSERKCIFENKPRLAWTSFTPSNSKCTNCTCVVGHLNSIKVCLTRGENKVMLCVKVVNIRMNFKKNKSCSWQM